MMFYLETTRAYSRNELPDDCIPFFDNYGKFIYQAGLFFANQMFLLIV